MNYILSFLFCGIVCAISQLVLEKTRWTPGHMNTLLVVVGCVLSGFGIYDVILKTFHAGASIPIINFGYFLVTGASEGYINNGFIGLFKGLLVNASAGISYTIVISFIISLLFKIKN